MEQEASAALFIAVSPSIQTGPAGTGTQPGTGYLLKPVNGRVPEEVPALPKVSQTGSAPLVKKTHKHLGMDEMVSFASSLLYTIGLT